MAMSNRGEIASFDWSALEHLKVIELGMPLEASTPAAEPHAPFRMGLMRRHGDFTRRDGGSGSNELITLCGHTGTHIDAVCHAAQDGLLHGGVPASDAVVGGRYAVHGVDKIGPIIKRGVLIDAASATATDSLEAAEPITADDLKRISDAQNTEIRAGDVVLIRTGWPNGRYDTPRAYADLHGGVPGVDQSGARFLVERGVFATGSDTIAYEHITREDGADELPVHRILLQEAGIPIMEVLNLEEVARAAIHEFLFVAVPLRIVGATASPIRPLAIVTPS